MTTHFWEEKTLDQLTKSEWESLCDGCAKCCLHKLQDDETEEIHYTRVVCSLLDTGTCQCTDYANRSVKVPDCLQVTPALLNDESALHWMPSTCAYRLLAENKPLPDWHPLLTGDKDSAVNAGQTMVGFAVSDADVADDEFEEYIIEFM